MSALIQIPLKHRVFSAGAWSIAGHGVSLMIRVGTSLFMTRQLLPEKFGVMAIASMILVGLAMFSDVGLKPSVIQSNRGSESAFLNTAWTTQIIRGVLLWFFGLNISLLIFLTNQFSTIQNDSAYGDQSLPFVVAVLSFTAVIGGFESTKLLQAGRSLSLASITTIEIVAQIFGVVAMIIWVMTVDRSVWALVSGAVSASLAKSILSHLSLAGTPNRFQWEKEAFREIIHFGKWIFLSSILSFFAANGDRMILAGLINADLLGNYAIAFLVLSSVDQISTKMIVDVSFPALSEVVRERPASLSVIYYKFQVIIASFAYFCCGLLVVAGHTLIHAMYDERYQQAGWMLEILALALLTVPFRIATQCFLALGVAKIYFQLHAVRITSLFLAIPLGFHFFGLQGAMWGIVFSYFSNLPSTILYAKKFGLFNLRKELGAGSFLVAGLLAGQMLNYVISFIRHL